MKAKIVIVFAASGFAIFYSLLIYAVSFAPFLGLTFDNYLCSLFSFVVVLPVVFLFVYLYYQWYDQVSFLRFHGTKYVTGFLISFCTLHLWDAWIDGVTIHLVTKIIFSLILMMAFSDDPNGFRSLKRLKKQTQGK